MLFTTASAALAELCVCNQSLAWWPATEPPRLAGRTEPWRGLAVETLPMMPAKWTPVVPGTRLELLATKFGFFGCCFMNPSRGDDPSRRLVLGEPAPVPPPAAERLPLGAPFPWRRGGVRSVGGLCHPWGDGDRFSGL